VIWLAVGLGGGIGAVARHAVNGVVTLRFGGGFPVGIFVVNTAGCLAIGLLAGLAAAGRLPVAEVGRTFLIAGLLGGFTTFSSFGLDTFTLLRGGQPALAFGNAAGQVVVGLFAVWLGFSAGSWVAR
jgi:CrcB protein